MPVDIKVVGMKEFDAKIDRLRRSLPNQLPLFKAITAELDKWENSLFQNEGRAIGWPRLKPIKWKGKWYRNARIKTTKGGKRKLEEGASLLQDTRWGRKSLTPKATNRSASVGTDIAYMIAHHRGSGHLPKRRVVPEFEDVRRQTLDAAWAFLRLKLRQSGL
jgi:phage gpG-like protein